MCCSRTAGQEGTALLGYRNGGWFSEAFKTSSIISDIKIVFKRTLGHT